MSSMPLKSIPNLSKDHLRAFGVMPSAISSKSRPQGDEAQKGKTPKNISKKAKYDKATESILTQLDLN